MLVVILGALFLWCYNNRFDFDAHVEPPMVRVSQDINWILLCIYDFEKDEFFITRNAENYLGECLKASYSSPEMRLAGARGYSTNTWTWLDPWKTPYDAEVIGVTMETNEFRALFGTNIIARVWSYGPNKMNEYGEGDDIAEDIRN